MKQWRISLLLIGMLFLTACFPARPIPTDPLTGIGIWDKLPAYKGKTKQFSQSSLGIILSDNVEQRIRSYQDWGKNMKDQKGRDNVNFTSGVSSTTSMLRRNFNTLAVVHDLNECNSMKLDYCAVLDWDRETTWGPAYKTSLQLFLLNAQAEKIAIFEGISEWRKDRIMDSEASGIVDSEKEALSKLETALRKFSP